MVDKKQSAPFDGPTFNGPMPGSTANVRRGAASYELQIEELVLHGFHTRDRYAIADAVERELTRLLAAPEGPGLARTGARIDRLDGGAFTVKSGSSGSVVGAQVAHALLGSLAASGRKSGAIDSKQTGKGPQQR
jgi:hypothetical protein